MVVRGLPLRDYALGIAIMSIGIFLNFFYFGYDLIVLGRPIQSHFSPGDLHHAVVMLLSIPGSILLGWVFIRERRARLQLEEAHRMKNLFLDVLRHDLLNPAGVVDNFIDLLLEDADESMRNDLLAMKRANRKILEIIEDATKLAKLESIAPEFKYIDLDAVIQDAIHDTEGMLREAGMSVEYRSPGNLPMRGMGLLYDVFTNLLSNAVKYAKEGGKVVIEVDDCGDHYLVRVRDFGEGIADEYKESVFERFQRKEKRGVRGVGLGLAIVRRIVELHGGRVWVEDNQPKGAVFVIKLPKVPKHSSTS